MKKKQELIRVLMELKNTGWKLKFPQKHAPRSSILAIHRAYFGKFVGSQRRHYRFYCYN